MRDRVYFVLLALAAPLTYLGPASAATWLSQYHFSAVKSQRPSLPLHFEAYIVNDLETNTCIYASFGTTQPHKELTRALDRGSSYHTERSIFNSGRARGAGKLERIRVFSNDTRVLKDYSTALCGHDDRGTFPIYDTLPREGGADEGIKVTGGDVPPLEIRPISESGDPSNRVDLVFFSDGCEFLR